MVRRGSTVRVRQRALQRPRKAGLFLSDEAARFSTYACMESVVENPALGALPTPAFAGSVLSRIELWSAAFTQMGQRRWYALAPAPERSSDARQAYARRVGEAGHDRRASSGRR